MPENMYGKSNEDVHSEDERKLQEFKKNHPDITNVKITLGRGSFRRGIFLLALGETANFLCQGGMR